MGTEEKKKNTKMIEITVLIIILLFVFMGIGYAIGSIKTSNLLNDKIEENNKIIEESVAAEEEFISTEKTMSESEALDLGNNLWQYAYDIYWKGTCTTTKEEVKSHFTDDVTISAPEPINSYDFSEYIGESTNSCEGGGRGSLQDYKTTTLKVDIIEEDEISFIATSEFCGGSFCNETQDTVKTIEKPFILKKVYDEWLIQSFYLPN